MDKYGHLDPLLMSVAPETLPTCCPGYLIISLQGLSLKMKIDFTVTILRLYIPGPAGPQRAQWARGPKNGKTKNCPIFPGNIFICSSRHVFIHKFQGLSLKMKIDDVMDILRFSHRAHSGPSKRPGGTFFGQIWPFGPLADVGCS